MPSSELDAAKRDEGGGGPPSLPPPPQLASSRTASNDAAARRTVRFFMVSCAGWRGRCIIGPRGPPWGPGQPCARSTRALQSQAGVLAQRMEMDFREALLREPHVVRRGAQEGE